MTEGAVLVTGSSGLIGGALVRRLLDEGYTVLATTQSEARAIAHPKLSWLSWDLVAEKPPRIGHTLGAILHAAAEIPSVHRDSESAARANRVIDGRLLDLMERHRVPLVYASSVSVYGRSASSEYLSETARVSPIGAYSEEKVWAESAGLELAERIGITFIALRICAPYGPTQRHRTVLRLFVERIVSGVPIFYHGSGTREQSFTHARDIARAFVLALRRKPGTGVFNIASGAPVTMKQLAYLVADLAGADPSLVRCGETADPQEGARARFNIDAARRCLSWHPEIPLSTGVLEWIATARERLSRACA